MPLAHELEDLEVPVGKGRVLAAEERLDLAGRLQVGDPVDQVARARLPQRDREVEVAVGDRAEVGLRDLGGGLRLALGLGLRSAAMERNLSVEGGGKLPGSVTGARQAKLSQT